MNERDFKQKPSTQVTFYDGRPIGKFHEDQLGRKQFARFFAEATASHRGDEGLVVGICAPWGEGKTSFKNMVVDLLRQEHSERVVVLSFNPWEWASQNQVSEAFFTEIAKQLEIVDKSLKAHEAAQRIRSLGAYLGLAGNILTPSGALLEGALPGASIVTLALGQGLKKAKAVAKAAAEDMEDAAKQAKKSLPEVKKELRDVLQAYNGDENKLILIVIDDIDRLAPEEIRLVFQLVRVNADFPGIVFMLLYDENYVVNALEKFFPASAKRFLEKIVQFQTTLPVIVENQLRNHVFDSLNRIFENKLSYCELLDKERFNQLWDAGLKEYLTNLRRCDRALSSFDFHIGVFRSDEAEVNPIDFFVLEVFQLFEGRLYTELYESSKVLFPGFDKKIPWHLGEHSGKEDPWKKQLEEITANVSNPVAKKLVGLLFQQPGFGVDFYGIATVEEQRALRERRLCHIFYFVRYFRMMVDEADITEQKVTNVQNEMVDPTRFVGELRRAIAEKALSLLITKLLGRQNLRAAPKQVAMMTALCDFGDEAADVPRQSQLVPPLEGLRLLVLLQSEKAPSPKDEFEMLFKGISESTGIHLPIILARDEDHREHNYSKLDDYERKRMRRPLEREDVKKLNVLVADRLERHLKAGKVYQTQAWADSIQWYMYFMQERCHEQPDKLLTRADVISLVLSGLINDQALAQYRSDRPLGIFGSGTVPQVRLIFGLDVFDKAITDKESELQAISPDAADRVLMYRELRKQPEQEPPGSVPPGVVTQDQEE